MFCWGFFVWFGVFLSNCFSAPLISPTQNPGKIFFFSFNVALLNFSYILNSIPHINANVCRKIAKGSEVSLYLLTILSRT